MDSDKKKQHKIKNKKIKNKIPCIEVNQDRYPDITNVQRKKVCIDSKLPFFWYFIYLWKNHTLRMPIMPFINIVGYIFAMLHIQFFFFF